MNIRNIRRNMVVIQQVQGETMKISLNKVDENRLDVLSVDMEIDIRKENKNITRHSGRMVHVIDWRIALYINGMQLHHLRMQHPIKLFKKVILSL
ncbi:hypothetical protein ACYCSU_13010 [Paenibacillus sp. ALE1]|uniref:hypothetical protein n=1 Tax=unclassified Paenibacillus TaxID=185978 RepID=UPI001EEC4D9D|nr:MULTISPECIES: hypothetical protein [unclassified Paenibacillus]